MPPLELLPPVDEVPAVGEPVPAVALLVPAEVPLPPDDDGVPADPLPPTEELPAAPFGDPSPLEHAATRKGSAAEAETRVRAILENVVRWCMAMF